MRLRHATIIAWAACSLADAATPPPSQRATATHWIATWGTSQLPLDAKDMIPAVRGDRGVTLRQTIRVAAST